MLDILSRLLFDRHDMLIGMRLVLVSIVTAPHMEGAVFGRHVYFSNVLNKERDAQGSGVESTARTETKIYVPPEYTADHSGAHLAWE